MNTYTQTLVFLKLLSSLKKEKISTLSAHATFVFKRSLYSINTGTESNLISVTPWKIFKDGSCERCHNEKLSNRRKFKQAAKFSGCYSRTDDMGPHTDEITTNNMHFLPIPPYLQNLTTVEMALISKITVVMNVHVLRYGMLASKGHCISLPQDMSIAKSLPLLPEEVGIVLLRRKDAKNDFCTRVVFKEKLSKTR